MHDLMPKPVPPPPMGTKVLAQQLAIACRILSDDGQEDFNQGQVSARFPATREMLVKQAMRGFVDAVPEDMILCPLTPDAPLPAKAPPELPLHQAIYAARPDVGAIIHTHAPHGTVFGATDMEIAPISHEGSYFVGNLGRFTRTSHTILDIGTGREVAEALGGGTAVFVVNHGVVVTGRTVRQCAVLAVMLERACRLQLLAEATGRPWSVAPKADVPLKRDYIYADVAMKSYWDALVARIRRSHPEIASWK